MINEIGDIEEFGKSFFVATEAKEWVPGGEYEEPNEEEYSSEPIIKEEIKKEEVKKIKKSSLQLEDFSGVLVEGFNIFLSYGGKFFIIKEFFSNKKEFAQAKKSYKKKKQGEELSKKEESLAERYSDFLILEEETLPLNEEERKKLEEDISRVLAKYDFVLSPEWSLAFTSVSIIVSRYLALKMIKQMQDV